MCTRVCFKVSLWGSMRPNVSINFLFFFPLPLRLQEKKREDMIGHAEQNPKTQRNHSPFVIFCLIF